MSLLHRIIAAIRSDHAQQAIGEFAPAMPAANYSTAEVALVDRPVVEPEEDWQAHETAPLLRQNWALCRLRRGGFDVTMG